MRSERLKTVRQAAQGNAAAATTPVIFLKNVLIREPEYRAAFAAVSTPRSEVGEPLMRLIALREPGSATRAGRRAADVFRRSPPAVAAPATTWAGAVWLTGEGRPRSSAAGPRELRLDTGATVPLPGGVARRATPESRRRI